MRSSVSCWRPCGRFLSRKRRAYRMSSYCSLHVVVCMLQCILIACWWNNATRIQPQVLADTSHHGDHHQFAVPRCVTTHNKRSHCLTSYLCSWGTRR
jgi:hypothetical protein